MVVDRAVNLGVVSAHDVIRDQEEGSSRVGDGGDVSSGGGSTADGVAGGGEAPEPLGVVDGGVRDFTRVFGVVDIAEVVGSRRALLQVGGEERGVETGFGVGEEGLLLVGLDGVDGGEGETEEAIGLILGEFRGDLLGELDGLAGDGGAAAVDGVGVDVAAGGAAVAVADGPGLAGELLGGAGVGGVVDVVAVLLGCG